MNIAPVIAGDKAKPLFPFLDWPCSTVQAGGASPLDDEMAMRGDIFGQTFASVTDPKS
jgi:hypothetical protein